MLRDMVERHGVRNVTSLRWPVRADLSDPARDAPRSDARCGRQAFPRTRRRLLTLTQNGLPTEPAAGVEMHSACEWLLEGAR